MCRLPEFDPAHSTGSAKSTDNDEPHEFRRAPRRYYGEKRQGILERIRSRILPDTLRRRPAVQAEAGYMVLDAQMRRPRGRRHRRGGWHDPEDVKRMYEDQGGRCFYCGKELDDRYEVDRKTPGGRGGTDWPENLCCACEQCIRLKKERTADEFKAYLTNLRRRR